MGDYRPKRLVFGTQASQNLFDDATMKIFGDISRCLNHGDDILIGARNWDEHNQTLEQVLQSATSVSLSTGKNVTSEETKSNSVDARSVPKAYSEQQIW